MNKVTVSSLLLVTALLWTVACIQRVAAPEGVEDAGNTATGCGQSSCTGCCVGDRCETGSGRAVSLAASATHLYWSINTVDRAQSHVRRCSLPACNDAVDISRGDPVFDLLLDGDNLYWFAEFQNDAGWETHLRRCAASGCLGGATTLLTGPTLRSLRVHGGLFYWAQGSSTGIRSCAVPDCTSPLTVVENAYVHGLAVDNAGVFWASGSIGSGVSTCPLAGCTTPRLLFGGGTEESQSLVLGPTHRAYSSTHDLFCCRGEA